MKTKQVLAVMITSLFLLYGCSSNEDNNQESALASKSQTLAKSASGPNGSSVINQEYPQAKQEVIDTFMAIKASIEAGAGQGANSEFMDQLISFHAYGPKFVEFNGGLSYDSAGNEDNERHLFGDMVKLGGVIKFEPLSETLKVAVYFGNVANLTFVSNFVLDIGEGEVENIITVNNLITLLFVKTEGKWKMVHEHHSPATL